MQLKYQFIAFVLILLTYDIMIGIFALLTGSTLKKKTFGKQKKVFTLFSQINFILKYSQSKTIMLYHYFFFYFVPMFLLWYFF